MSEIRVDTISEKTSANGVTIDGLTIKDGGITATTGAIVFNEASADVDFRVESNGNTHQLFVDAGTDNTMIGTSTNIDRWFNSAPGKSTIFQTSGIDDANRVNAFTHHANNSGGAMVMLGKSRGGAVGYTAVAESDEIGQISFQGADGTDMVEAAKIIVAVDTAPGANDMPGRMSFHTTANGAASSTERMRIHNNGVASFNNGIALGVGTANTASNVLDDYEEGTFAYTITGSTSGNLVLRSGYGRGSYVKIGNLVHVDIRFETTSDNSLSGNVYWSLPFTMANPNGSDADAATAPGYIRDQALGTDARTGVYLLSEGNAFVYLIFSREGAANSTTVIANNTNTDGVMEGTISITYRTT
jgi:hypothetical protein